MEPKKAGIPLDEKIQNGDHNFAKLLHDAEFDNCSEAMVCPYRLDGDRVCKHRFGGNCTCFNEALAAFVRQINPDQPPT